MCEHIVDCTHRLKTDNINMLRPREQSCRCFADDIFKLIFLNEDKWISLKISLMFVPRARINNIPALVQILAWHLLGDKPLSQPMMASSLTHVSVTRWEWVKAHVIDYMSGYGPFSTLTDTMSAWKNVLRLCREPDLFENMFNTPSPCDAAIWRHGTWSTLVGIRISLSQCSFIFN